MYRSLRSVTVAWGLMAVAAAAGCSGWRTAGLGRSSVGRGSPIRHVISLYDQKPWLNLDVAGDRDPEGIHYRVFLDAGSGRGVHRDGTFVIAMYQIDRKASGETERTLVSDWKYPTSSFLRIKSKLLGMGYHLRLRWASKKIAGHEIEVVTRYKDPDGNMVGAGTKRLRVPKYTS